MPSCHANYFAWLDAPRSNPAVATKCLHRRRRCFPSRPERKLGLLTAVHTPWSAILHAGLTILGFYCHRNALHTAGITGFHPLAVGPGPVGLVEPCVSLSSVYGVCKINVRQRNLTRFQKCTGLRVARGLKMKSSADKASKVFHRKNPSEGLAAAVQVGCQDPSWLPRLKLVDKMMCLFPSTIYFDASHP